MGAVVGFSVRMDSRTSRRTRLLFCTTGELHPLAGPCPCWTCEQHAPIHALPFLSVLFAL